MRFSTCLRMRLALVLLVFTVGLLSSACYLQLLVLAFGSQSGGYPSYDESYTATIGTTAVVAECDDGPAPSEAFLWTVGCQYMILDNGYLVDLTSSFELISEHGLLGVFIDPLIVQLPQSVRVQAATLTSGVVPVPLVVTETPTFPVTPKISAAAEQGMKFLIIELPESVSGAITGTDIDHGVQLKFDLTLSTAAVDFPLKALFAVRVDTPSTHYYLPTLPCTSNFTEIPAVSVGYSLAQSSEGALAQLAAQYAEMACTGQVYDLRAPPEPPRQGSFRLFLAAVAAD